VVTDPPYELGFMGKAWDGSGVAYDVDLWAEVLRVLKPGGHLCAFGGTRTYHRMACAIEDAGFEIRDSLHWVYGSGFPKSLDVSKAIDKTNGEPDRLHKFTAWMRTTGMTARQLDELTDTNMGGHYLTAKSQPAIPTAALWAIIRPHIAEVPDWVDELVARIEAEREVVGKSQWSNSASHFVPGEDHTQRVQLDITTAATDAAKQWEGWGTALKPAHEPIVLARKPLIGTVAANVLTHGTGALNIDGARVASGDDYHDLQVTQGGDHFSVGSTAKTRGTTFQPSTGRWPANVIFDTEAGALLDEQTQHLHNAGTRTNYANRSPFATGSGELQANPVYPDLGGASRFFTAIEWEPEIDVPFRYVPKPSKRERNAGLDALPERKWKGNYGDGIQDNRPHTREGYTYESTTSNHHPTVKPLALMRWLVKLVTPPGGTVLEPFAGSGTTLMACVMENYDAIGIELTDEYLPIIRGRVAWAEQQAQQTPDPTEHVQETLPL
jgi:DNA modification methylase